MVIPLDTSGLKLSETAIFKGMSEDEIQAAMCVLQAHDRSYKKGETVFHAGETTDSMGLMLEGSVTIRSDDLWGNRTILSHVGPGQFFAETYAFLREAVLLVDVCANENCRILFFRIGALQGPTGRADPWLLRLTTNLLVISSHKNLILSERSFHTAPRTIRARLLAYLHTVSVQRRSAEFDIPFDRQQLADYLNIDRTALSRELGRMQDEGLIAFRKNHFVIHNKVMHSKGAL